MGQGVSGTVDSVTNFSVFVKLAPRLTALLPMSEIDEAHKALSEAAAGTEVSARVIAIDASRKRMTLSTRAEGAPAARKRAPRHDEASDAPRAPRGERGSRHEDNSYKEEAKFGTFGDVLAGLMRKK